MVVRIQDMGTRGARHGCEGCKTWHKGFKGARHGCEGCKTRAHNMGARDARQGHKIWVYGVQDMATLPGCKTWMQKAHNMAVMGCKTRAQGMGAWGAIHGYMGCKT